MKHQPTSASRLAAAEASAERRRAPGRYAQLKTYYVILKTFTFFIILILAFSCRSRDREDHRNESIQIGDFSLNETLSKEEAIYYFHYLDSLIDYYKQKHTKAELVDCLNDTIYEYMYIGNPGELSEDFLCYEALKRMIQLEEVKNLMNNESPMLRVYGLQMGIENFDMGSLKLVKAHIEDTTRIRTIAGDALYEMKLIELVIERVYDRYLDFKETPLERKNKLSNSQRKRLERIIAKNGFKIYNK